MPAGCTVSNNYQVQLAKPSGGTPDFDYPSGNPASSEFSSLQPGIYTVTVSDITTGKKVVKTINITTTYKTMNITDIQAKAPTCSSLIDGTVQFKIPSGGIGPFEVTIRNKAGGVLVPAQTYPRPTPASNYITIKGVAGKELRSGDIKVVIKDLAGGNPTCGDTQTLPMVIPPAEIAPGCFSVTVESLFFEMGANCAYKLRFPLNKLG